MSAARSIQENSDFIVPINDKNIQTYINLARSYEAEFSNLTHKMPNESGIFEPDTLPVAPYSGFLLYRDKSPVGFCVVELNDKINDVAEFYIIPALRGKNLGHILATTIFDMHPGEWQVRQISGAESAKAFWRKVIGKHTHNQFTEAVVNDPDWGMVTCQKFTISTLNKSEKITFFNGVLNSYGVFALPPVEKSADTDSKVSIASSSRH